MIVGNSADEIVKSGRLALASGNRRAIMECDRATPGATNGGHYAVHAISRERPDLEFDGSPGKGRKLAQLLLDIARSFLIICLGGCIGAVIGGIGAALSVTTIGSLLDPRYDPEWSIPGVLAGLTGGPVGLIVGLVLGVSLVSRRPRAREISRIGMLLGLVIGAGLPMSLMQVESYRDRQWVTTHQGGWVRLNGALLRGARLPGAHLRGANICESNLAGADLTGADLRDAELCGTSLRRANLAGADLSWAGLADVDLSSTNLKGANLTGAHLQGGDDYAGTDLTGAVFDRHTRWPSGFDPRKHGAKLEE